MKKVRVYEKSREEFCEEYLRPILQQKISGGTVPSKYMKKVRGKSFVRNTFEYLRPILQQKISGGTVPSKYMKKVRGKSFVRNTFGQYYDRRSVAVQYLQSI